MLNIQHQQTVITRGKCKTSNTRKNISLQGSKLRDSKLTLSNKAAVCAKCKNRSGLMIRVTVVLYLSSINIGDRYGPNRRYKILDHCLHPIIQLKFKENSKIYKYSATLRRNTESPLFIQIILDLTIVLQLVCA